MASIIQLFGFSTLTATFGKLKSTASKSVGSGLRMLGEEIMTESKLIVPVDVGKLRSSGFVRQDSPTSVILGYGTDYALAVHEIPPPTAPAPDDPPQWRPGSRTARHHWPTQWKFLEKPARRRWDNIGSSFDDVLDGGDWPLEA